MTIRVSFKNLRSSLPLQLYASEKSEKLKKFLNGNFKLNWDLSIEKFNRIAHCRVSGGGVHIVGEAVSKSMEESIDAVVEKLESQLRKLKNHKEEHSREAHRRAAA